MTDKKFATDAIHHGYDSKEMLGSLATPLYQSATFEFPSAERGEASFLGEADDYIYTRVGNPTVDVLQERIARLEGGESALAFSSGMGAISAVLLALIKANDHIVCSPGVYGSTFGFLSLLKEKFAIDIEFSNLKSEAEVKQAIKENTACIYIETPINPTMQLIDLQLVSSVAKKKGIPVVVDNTFSSPYLQRPLELGVDVVVHSATKYLNGHGDVIAGLAIGKSSFIEEKLFPVLKDVGAVLSPFDAWLLLRGMKTLAVRMNRHCDNAERIVSRLKEHKNVIDVYYPKIDTSGIYAKQMRRGGGVIAFKIKGDKKMTQSFLNEMKFIKVAVSLGDAETLIEHPATMTHAVIPEDERLRMGITDNLIRLSVGLEDWEDIWNDLNRALNTL